MRKQGLKSYALSCRAFRAAEKMQRKKLEATLGLPMWATSTCPHIRPYLAPLYEDLHSAAGALKLIHPQFWQPLLDSWDDGAGIIAQPPGPWLPVKAKVIFAGNAPIKCKADLPKVTPAQSSARGNVDTHSRPIAHRSAPRH